MSFGKVSATAVLSLTIIAAYTFLSGNIATADAVVTETGGLRPGPPEGWTQSEKGWSMPNDAVDQFAPEPPKPNAEGEIPAQYEDGIAEIDNRGVPISQLCDGNTTERCELWRAEQEAKALAAKDAPSPNV